MLLNYNQNYSYILNARSAIYYALTEWKSCLNITFSETTKIEEADIKISFISKRDGGNFPFDGPGNVLGHAFYPYTSKKGIVELDTDEDWNYNLLFDVLLHEFGHTFGIGHSSVKEAVMYEYYTGAKKLHDDDCNAIGSLYGLKSKWGPIYTNKSTTIKPTIKPTFKRHYKINRNGKDINIYNSHITIN